MHFLKAYDLNNNVIRMGPLTLVTVDEGYAAVTEGEPACVVNAAYRCATLALALAFVHILEPSSSPSPSP